MSIPSIMLPISLRSHVVSSKYRSLKRYEFSALEKLWVWRHLIEICDDLETELIPQILSFWVRYNMRVDEVISWLTIFADSDGGIHIF